MSHTRRSWSCRLTAAWIALALTLAAMGCPAERPVRQQTLTIFAAASTAPFLDDVADRFEQASGAEVVRNYASSSVLAQQIAAGAPADLFLSASAPWMDDLQQRGLVVAASRRNLLANALVLVAPLDAEAPQPAPGSLAQGVGSGRIAVGDVSHVPLGVYSRQALESAGAWNDELVARLVPAADARAALRLVEMSAVDAGIVYASDATTSRAVRVVLAINETTHEPIRYPIAMCHGAGPIAEQFMEFLDSIDLGAAAAEHGLLARAHGQAARPCQSTRAGHPNP